MMQFNVEYIIDSEGNSIPYFKWLNNSFFRTAELVSEEIEIVISEYELNMKHQKL